MILNNLNKVDRLLAALGVVFGILITSLYSVSPTIRIFSIGMALTLSCSLYLIINHAQFSVYPYQTISRKGKTILDIVFLLSFSLSLIILHNSDYRPLSYFLIYSLCVGSVAVSIFFSANKLDYLIQYSKIILLSFNIEYSIFNLAGFVPGIDSWGHARMNDLLSQTGNIGVLFNKEMYFPIMHIQTAIMEIISNVPIKDASNFAIIVPFVLASSFVYLASKYFLGERGGLFAMLLVIVSDFNIYWGSAPQTTSYGIILYYLVIYILVKSYFLKYSPKYASLLIFLVFTLTITHAVSSFIFVITILSLLFGSFLYSLIYEERITSKFEFISISLISVISLIQYWFFAIYSKETGTFFDVIFSWFYYYITGHAGFLNRPETVSIISTTLPPFLERFVDTFGLFLYLFFGIVGSLFCLSPKYRSKTNFIFIFSLTTLFGITFVFPLFGLRNIIPTRWFSFEYFILSILASFSILKLTTYLKSRRFRSIFIAVIFISSSFFMSASTISNLDSPVWLKNDTISTTFTLEEVKGAETLSKFGTNFIADNSFGSLAVALNSKQHLTIFSPSIRLNHGEIFLWRSYMEKRPVEYFTQLAEFDPISSNFVPGPNYHSKLIQYDKIYDNKDLSAYYIS